MKIIKVSNTIIHFHQGPIGISCSGGVDSSLLLFILMNYVKDPIHIFTCASKLKNYGTVKSSIDVIKKCIELTNNNNITHTIRYVDNQTVENLFYPQQYSLINVMYTGITLNPPKEVTDTFIETTLETERDPGTIKSFYKQTSKLTYMPFANIDKKEVFNIYKELNLLESLYPLTRSCEDINLSEGHCGKCWWCEERLWAFEKL